MTSWCCILISAMAGGFLHFFPFLAFYKAAIDKFFHEQKKLHRHLSSMMEEQWQHAFCSILCLSLNDTIHELKRPDLWKGSFGDEGENEHILDSTRY